MSIEERDDVGEDRSFVILNKASRKWRMLAAFEAYHLLSKREKKYFMEHANDDYTKLHLQPK